MKYTRYRLDNSAIVYQMVLTPRAQSLFRLGARLSEDIEPEALQNAVNMAFRRHPRFKTELKRGFFRPYLRENNLPFYIEKHDGTVLKFLDFSKNNNYLLRISYSKNSVYIDYFHGLCDGYGGMEFLKTVLFYYAAEMGKSLPSDGILTLPLPSDSEENEDAFERYYTKPNLRRGAVNMAGGRAYSIRGAMSDGIGLTLTSQSFKTDALLSAARSFNCSLTVFLTAIMLQSVAKMHINGTPKHELTAFIPVNLRNKFPSSTLCNFTVFAKIIIPKSTAPELEALIPAVREGLAEQLDDGELKLKLGFTSLMSRALFLRCLPLFFKCFISRVGRKFSAPKQTFILSNLGNITAEPPLVDEFFFNLNCNRKTPKNVAVVSYGNSTVISFTRKTVSAEVEREFFSTLASLCN